MKMLVAAAVFGIATPAFAHPWDHAFKPDRVSVSQDGRGDIEGARAARLEALSRPENIRPAQTERPAFQAVHREMPAPIPYKASVTVQMGMRMPANADETKIGPQALPQAQTKPSNLGRSSHGPALPLKTEYALKMQSGDHLEDAAAKGPAGASGAHANKQALTPYLRQALCAQAGICFRNGEVAEDVGDKSM